MRLIRFTLALAVFASPALAQQQDFSKVEETAVKVAS